MDDFGSKRRERVVRLDVPMQAFQPQPGSGRGGRGQQALQGVANAAGGLVIPGLDQYSVALRESVRVCFEARQAAYAAEVRAWWEGSWEWGWNCNVIGGLQFLCSIDEFTLAPGGTFRSAWEAGGREQNDI